ncbi:MAG: YiiX/YebB-like N1pC/P60 family cysteine hydrolase, partial [Desulfobulbaceae bacterium]|nr:YiiX/YebB-like N1pC/P60 family cysteine hydrolase [Desulfobulbaceae bacterium]
KQLTEIAGQYHSPRNRYRIQRAISYFDRSWRRQNCSFKSDETNDYLYTLISQSPSYNTTLKSSPLHAFNRYAALFADITTDALLSARDEGVNLLSLLFGNSVGMVKTRNGYLHNRPEVEEKLQKRLRAGDILLEKTPFCLTDKLIPGYWGHVAIWIGSEQELIDLGIWDHPVVSAHKKAIRGGRYIVEALRTGVMINSLSYFLDIDDLAILRKKKSTGQERAETIIRALQQVGKPYDFNFNVETNNKIVCSELIYICYTDINWPTSNTLGRYTISPSNVAEKAGPEEPFEVVDLYLHGQEVRNNMLDEFLKTVASTAPDHALQRISFGTMGFISAPD